MTALIPMAIGGALSAGSAGLNSAAAAKVNRARQQANDFARAQQQQLDAQAATIQDGSRARYDNFGQQQATIGQQLGDYFAKQNGVTTSAPDLPVSSSNIVTAENVKQDAKTAAYSGQQATALGNLRSFGDVMGELNRGQARDAQQLGTINNFKAGDASLLPYALDAAGHAGDGLKQTADIVGGLGRIGIAAGAPAAGQALNSALGGIFGTAPPTVGAGATASASAALPKIPTFAQTSSTPFRLL